MVVFFPLKNKDLLILWSISWFQYPKSWAGKCLIPVAQRLEHSACNWEIMGLSPTRNELPSTSEPFNCFKNNSSVVENGCCCSCMVGILCVNLYKQNIYITRASMNCMRWKISHSHSSVVRALGMKLEYHGFVSHLGQTISHLRKFWLFQ